MTVPTALLATVLVGMGSTGTLYAQPSPGAEQRAGSAGLAGSQTIDGPPPPHAPEVIARDDAGRVTIRAVKLVQDLDIDGRLDETAYAQVTPISGFIQQVPDEGEAATEKTEVWVFYDEAHVYVAARLWESVPEAQ